MNISALSRRGLCGLIMLLVAFLSLKVNAAVIAITSLSDIDESDDSCTLREAIVAANSDMFHHGCMSGSGADEIVWHLPGTVELTSSLPIITSGVTVRGLGMATTRIDGGGSFRVFEFSGPANGNDVLAIESMRVSGGLNRDGGAIRIGAGRSLRVVDSMLVGNRAMHSGGAIDAQSAISIAIERSSIIENASDAGSGGGISAFGGSLSVVESTVADNVATLGSGGGIEAYAVSELHIDRSTLSSNRAGAHGGGIRLLLASIAQVALIQSTTIVANVADQDQSDSGFGGGIDVAGPGTVTLRNSIVALNRALVTTTIRCPDIDIRLNAVLVSQGYNLVGIGACAGGALIPGLPNANQDFVGTDVLPLDPRVGPLSANGGSTQTHLPLPDSPVVDNGSCPGEINDQRGLQSPATGLRVFDEPGIANLAEGCDIGSVEGSGFPSDLLFRDGFDPSS